MPQQPKYNGWRNRQTWNVMLWLDNDEGYYHAYRRQLKWGKYTAATAEQFVRDLWPSGYTPDGDLMVDVDWRAIAKAMNAQ